ncbi:MAG: penicillin-binding protein activator LpoB [Bacteroidales bacterium]|nr:penicillin-binding protein activator LpoB [Bacteroidales bacterium]
MSKYFLIIAIFLCANSMINAQNRVETIESQKDNISDHSKKFIKRKVAIGRFSNETQYGKGVFYDKANDPMAKQALDILSSKLAMSEKFILLERNDLQSLVDEANINKSNLSTIGADYIIIGSITEFGRKNVGSTGVLTTKKTQIVEAAVSMRLIDVATGMIIYSDEAKGSAEITTKTTMGVGGIAGYDATLSDKAISEAIGQLVENIINKCSDKPWRTYFISYDNDAVIIAGGKSQGLQKGDKFDIYTKGKTVKNPQTNLSIELPGKKIGFIEIVETGGNTEEAEYSFVTVTTNEKIDQNKLEEYYIEEVKE